jgi:OHCU decarboxylase
MNVTLEKLNEMSEPQAAELLKQCCGSTQWVFRMLAKRPFPSREDLLRSADEIWNQLGRKDWLEAFAHHPRIGEKKSEKPQGVKAEKWSKHEQAGVKEADDSVRDELARINHEYDVRFGYIYIVCASGKSAEELLAMAQERMKNDPEVEIGVAVEEQRKITRLRLERLIEG